MFNSILQAKQRVKLSKCFNGIFGNLNLIENQLPQTKPTIENVLMVAYFIRKGVMDRIFKYKMNTDAFVFFPSHPIAVDQGSSIDSLIKEAHRRLNYIAEIIEAQEVVNGIMNRTDEFHQFENLIEKLPNKIDFEFLN